MVLSVIRLQEADVVGSVDLAISGHFGAEVLTVIIRDSTEEVIEDVFMLALHVHVIQLGNDDSLVEAHLFQESATTLQK